VLTTRKEEERTKHHTVHTETPKETHSRDDQEERRNRTYGTNKTSHKTEIQRGTGTKERKGKDSKEDPKRKGRKKEPEDSEDRRGRRRHHA
jgi:hypothetical protein